MSRPINWPAEPCNVYTGSAKPAFRAKSEKNRSPLKFRRWNKAENSHSLLSLWKNRNAIDTAESHVHLPGCPLNSRRLPRGQPALRSHLIHRIAFQHDCPHSCCSHPLLSRRAAPVTFAMWPHPRAPRWDAASFRGPVKYLCFCTMMKSLATESCFTHPLLQEREREEGRKCFMQHLASFGDGRTDERGSPALRSSFSPIFHAPDFSNTY